jgi:hypothetical protein
MKNEIILYQSDELPERIEVRMENETVWLSQKQMSLLFNKNVMTINEHVNNVYEEGELNKASTIRKSLIVQKEGKRNVKREILFYNLDVVISVGYRVKSKQGTQFRIWATNVLKDYLLKGYAINNRMNRFQQLQLDLKKANEQYGNFTVKMFAASHDRFLMIDQKDIYHIGASLKDLGKKWFAFSKLEKNSVQGIVEKIKEIVE